MPAGSYDPAEASMEEILASIRRIISDEKEDEQPKPEGEAAAAPAAAPTEAPVEDDSLVLTDEVQDGTNIQIGGGAAPKAEVSTEPEKKPAAPVQVTPEAVAPEPPKAEAPAPVVEKPAPAPEPPKVEAKPAPAPVAPKPAPVAQKLPEKVPEEFDVAETVAENKKLADTYRGLVSPPVKEKSTLTFEALADAIHSRGTPLGNTNMTLEDLIRDLLRPHLKEWLDDNLPGLVEKLVRAEIERMTREAEERKDLI
jgi:cell pole-organizing protein PopZ